jgi:hypothetical protein
MVTSVCADSDGDDFGGDSDDDFAPRKGGKGKGMDMGYGGKSSGKGRYDDDDDDAPACLLQV